MDSPIEWESSSVLLCYAKELVFAFFRLVYAEGPAEKKSTAERYKRFVAIRNENTVYYSYAHRKHLFDFGQTFLLFLNLIWCTIVQVQLLLGAQ